MHLRLVIAILAFTTWGCSSSPHPRELDGDSLGNGFHALTADLLSSKGTLESFAETGPIKFDLQRNVVVQLRRGRSVVLDNIIPRSASPTPLVILVHGNRSRKEAHRHQAELLASYGIHALALDVPNRNQWLANSVLVKELVDSIVKSPEKLGGHIDPHQIILAGHSFGGSAVTLAASRGAPVLGLILLDPAVFGPEVEVAMKRVKQPVLLLGADRDIFKSRKRPQFYQSLKGEVLELSVTGATHDDAQLPSMYALTTYGIDPYTSPKRQSLFAKALVAGAFSLAATGGLDYVAEASDVALKVGSLKNPHRRAAANGVRKAE